ncbi:hypothetical protein PIB30_053218 [Stylosanthes scabra]|uniref:Cellular nucleic acid-binding protein n=1 Tax=Stylosanthes scabra TaxID=79078 RepID=A0ABU6SID5_9FABA|nr:hypothetical protein [Stylosanthes scabra]
MDSVITMGSLVTLLRVAQLREGQVEEDFSSKGFLLFLANLSGDDVEIEKIPVVREFPKVFPEDIPKFPHKEK